MYRYAYLINIKYIHLLSPMFMFFIDSFQATGLDQAAGYGMVLLAATVFTYYTLWVVVLVSDI